MNRRSALLVGMGGMVLAIFAAVFILVAKNPRAFIREAMDVVYFTESKYQNIYVTREGSVVWLRAGSLLSRSSAMDEQRPLEHVIEYTRMMMIGVGYVREPSQVLVVGLGGGTIPKYLREYYPEARIVNVEFDQAVVDVAERFFDFSADENMEVVVEDGRRFLAVTDEHFDMIFLDAFHGDYIPFHLMTKEFLELVKSRLTPDGIVVSNTWMSQELSERESATYAAVFGSFDSYRGVRSLNRIIIAEKSGRKRRAESLEQEMVRAQNQAGFRDIDLPTLFERHHYENQGPWEAKVLVDDFAPVNLLVKTIPAREGL